MPPESRPAARGGSLFRRLLLAMAGVVAAVLALVLAVLSLSAGRAADAALARGLEHTRRHAAERLVGRERALASAALVFAQDPAFRALLLERRPADLHDQAIEAVERTGASWAQVTDADGVRLARSDDPGAPPVALAGTALVAGALAGSVVTGVGVVGDSALVQGVAVPVMLGPQVAGVLMAAAALDGAAARELAAAIAGDVLLYARDDAGRARVTAATLPRSPALDALAAAHARRVDAAAGGDPDATAADAADAPLEATLDGARYVGRGDVLRSAAGEPLGGVVTLRARAPELAPFAQLRRRVALAGALGLALAAALSWGVARQLARPLLALTAAARRATAGDLAAADRAAGAPAVADAGGEIGALAAAMREVLLTVRERRTVAAHLERLAGGAPTPPAPPALPAGAPAPGDRLAGRYAIEAVLGVGGSGVVYRARDLALQETVALKTLRPGAVAGGAAALERLKDELRLARRLAHPNIVRIHDLGEDRGRHFITMEHLAGQSLADLLAAHGALPVAVALAVGAQLCEALAAAHAQGVIHRDVKPHNLMLRPDGGLTVMDFGIARLAEREAGMTTEGTVVGTPAYMAPEQLLGEAVDARADVYAAGVVLYECLTGRHPLGDGTPHRLLARLLAGDVAPPHALVPAVPPAVSAVVLSALAYEPAARPASAADLRALLAAAG